MKKFLVAISILICSLSVKAQIYDTSVLRSYINTSIVPNTSKSITAQMMSNILNGNLNVLPNLLGRYYDSIWVSGGNLFMRRKGVTTNVSISAVEADPVWSAASVNYWLGTRTGDSLFNLRAGINTKLAITDAASIYTTISRTIDSLAALQARIQTKEPLITAGITGQYWRGDKSWQTLDKTAVGLSNVDNTSDANKPISTATQTALDGKQNTIGYTPENVANKATDFTTVNNTLYPTVQAVNNAITTATGNYVPLSQKGANNGVATLDVGGKVPFSQLPAALFIYKGTWNVATNSPALSDGTGVAGWIYVVSTGGTINLGSGNITFSAGDYALHNGSTWERSVGTNNVASVNGQQGIVTLTTANISESGNLYYTDTRVQTYGDGRYPQLTGSYSNPSWITGLAWSKITGAPSFLTSESDPVYVASSWYSTTNNASNWNTAYGWGNHASAGYASTGGSYSDPAWITALAWSKLTGVPSTFTPSAHTHPYSDLTGTVPTWNQNTTGNAATATTATNWGVVPNSLNSPAEASGLTNLIGVHSNTYAYKFTAGAVQTWLGLGSNAYNSTSFLPLSAGSSNRLTGVLYTDFGLAVKSAYGDMYVARGSNFGYSNSYGVVMLGYTGTANESLAFGVDLSSNPSGLFTGNGNEYFWRETGSFKTPNAANNGYNTLFSWTNATLTFPNGVNFSSSVAASSFEAPIFYKSGTGNSWLINQSGYANRGLYWDQSELGWHFYDNGSARVKLGIDGSVTGAGTFTAGSFSGAGTGLTGTASSLSIGGNAATVTNGVYTNTTQTISGEKTFSATYTYVNTLRASGDVIAYYSSDRRLKNNIKPINNALGMIDRIGGYSYTWNNKQEVYTGRDYGVIAQEIEAIMPEAVTTRANGYKAVKYERLIPLLIQAVKELKHEIELLKK